MLPSVICCLAQIFLTVKQKILFNTFVFIFKIRNRLVPDYVCDKTNTFSNVHQYNTQNKSNFIISDRPKSNIVSGSVLYRGLLDFNNLPVHIKDCTRLEMFRRHLRAYIVQQYRQKFYIQYFNISIIFFCYSFLLIVSCFFCACYSN